MALPEIKGDGRLCADPELRYTPSGTPVASMRVACNKYRKNKTTGEWESGATTFLTINAWNGLAENLMTRFKKGQVVHFEGEFKVRTYEAKDGSQRLSPEVEAGHISDPVPRFKSDNNGAPQQQVQQPQQSPWQQQPQPLGGFGGGADEQPPF